MRILVIGGTGVIGSAVVAELAKRHTVVVAARRQGDFQVDISDRNSIENLFQSVGQLDAVVSTTGQVHFGPLAEMTEQNFAVGFNSKLMGQINLVLVGMHYLQEGGSFTLTSGILNHDPIRYGAAASLVNGALDGFVKAAALEMPQSQRINIVSPTLLTESLSHYGDYFRGFLTVPAAKVALAYSKSVEGAQTGQVYQVWS